MMLGYYWREIFAWIRGALSGSHVALTVNTEPLFLTDKSKPGVTQGRKATGPSWGLAGLPKGGRG